MAKKKAKAAEKVGFETSLSELEKIIADLEKGELTLDESLVQYEAGVKHLKACYELLNAAERRIELVSGLDADGRPHSEPFEDCDDEDLETKASARSKKRTAGGRRGGGDASGVDDAATLF